MPYSPNYDAQFPPWLVDRINNQGLIVASQVLAGEATTATGNSDTDSATLFTTWKTATNTAGIQFVSLNNAERKTSMRFSIVYRAVSAATNP